MADNVTTCDATLAYSDPTDAGACSDDRVTVWHGMDSPAIGCGKHAYMRLPVALFRGHRVRLGLARPWAEADGMFLSPA